MGLVGAFIAAVLFGLNNTVSNSVKDCSAGKSLFTFISGSLLPDPIVPGEDSYITLNLEIPAGCYIDAGTAKYSFSFNGIPFAPTTENLCSDVACPLGPGPYTNTTTSVFPTGVNGKIVTRIEWLNTAKEQLMCVDVTAKT
jgi:hypothetical protein